MALVCQRRPFVCDSFSYRWGASRGHCSLRERLAHGGRHTSPGDWTRSHHGDSGRRQVGRIIARPCRSGPCHSAVSPREVTARNVRRSAKITAPQCSHHGVHAAVSLDSSSGLSPTVTRRRPSLRSTRSKRPALRELSNEEAAGARSGHSRAFRLHRGVRALPPRARGAGASAVQLSNAAACDAPHRRLE